MAAPPRRRDSPPVLPDEIVEEILLRLPPEEPACILRVSLVCKSWATTVSSPWFRRRLHELHHTPPVLGFLHNWDNERIPRFIPTTASSFSLAAPDCRNWCALDCRHGRAVFLSKGQDTNELLAWEPITGAQRRIPVPVPASSGCRLAPGAAVFCAADGCNHLDCHGGPFHLVFVFTEYTNADDYVTSVTSACLYSSETGAWGELTSVHGEFDIDFTFYSGVLVGRSLFYFLSDSALIVEYDLARHELTVFDPPGSQYYDDTLSLMLAEDGGLGLSQTLDQHLKLWSRKASSGTTDAQWVLSQVVYFENLLPNGAPVNATRSLDVLGFAEGANVIFVTTVIGLFTVELESGRMRKVCDNHGFCNLIPVVSFYTPVPCGKHHDSPRVTCYEKLAPEGASTLKNMDVPCYLKLNR
uniref:Uncharacterized protein n=1 Tax=Avena sativa TaxID=4498 RepID=A0ACD6ABG3_AVESA